MLDPRGWASLLLPILCFVLGTILGVLLDGFIAAPGAVSDFLIRLQTLFGIAIAVGVVAIAGAIAYARVRRQLAVQVLTREEDRMEANFAGLEDAERLLLNLRTDLAPSGRDEWGAIPRDKLSRQGLWIDPDGMANVVLRKLPNTDIITRKRVEGILNYLVFWIGEGMEARTRAAKAKHDVDLARQAPDMKPELRADYEARNATAAEELTLAQASYEQSRRRIDQLQEELNATILRWHRDRPVIRQILAAHLGEAIARAKH